MSRPAVIRPQVVALKKLGLDSHEIARKLGTTTENVYSLVKFARLAGELPHTGIKRAEPYRRLPEWPPEAEPQPTRCPRCHLAEPHQCVRSIYEYARQQSRDAE